MTPSLLDLVATGLFALAVAHTFLTKYFEHLAHLQPRHAGLWHLLGEVEVVFGFWAFVLVFMAVQGGPDEPTRYLERMNYTEPAFVFVVMVVAASRPVLELCKLGARALARLLPFSQNLAL